MAFQWTGQANNPNINPQLQEALNRLSEQMQGQMGVGLYGTSGKRNWGTNSHHETGNAADGYFGSNEAGSEWDDPARRGALTPQIRELARGVGLDFLDENDHLHFYNAADGVVPGAAPGGQQVASAQPRQTAEQYGQLKAPQLFQQIMDKYNAQKEIPRMQDSAAMQLQLMIAAGEGGKLHGSEYASVAPYAQSLASAHAIDAKNLADFHNQMLEQKAHVELMQGLGALNQDGKRPEESFALGTLAPALMPFVKATTLDAGQQATIDEARTRSAQQESHFQQTKGFQREELDYRKKIDDRNFDLAKQKVAGKAEIEGPKFSYDSNVKSYQDVMKAMDNIATLPETERQAEFVKILPQIQATQFQASSMPDGGKAVMQNINLMMDKIFPKGAPS